MQQSKLAIDHAVEDTTASLQKPLELFGK